VFRTARALTRIPSGDKIIESRLLNVLGVQVLRTIAARTIYNARFAHVNDSIKDTVDELRREGIVVWPDFLPTGQFEAVRRESEVLLAKNHGAFVVDMQGPNGVESARVANLGERVLPNTYRLLADPRLQAVFESAEKRRLGSLVAYAEIERLIQGPDGAQEDPEARLHSDVFYNTHKAWLYLTDVTAEDGPFAYVRRSHWLTLVQLRHIYAASDRRRRSENHSRRIKAEEIEALGLRETVLTCPRNTLVIANTCGYHRRLRGRPGLTRVAVHLSVRANPFTAIIRGLKRDAS
jgi:phytanoyl-CoA dioxygenase PhyH